MLALLQLLQLLLTVAAAAAGVGDGEGECQLSAVPPAVNLLAVGGYSKLVLNCSCCSLASQQRVVMVKFLMANSLIAAVSGVTRRPKQPHARLRKTCDYSETCTFAELSPSSPMFVEANNVGRTSVKILAMEWNVSSWDFVLESRRSGNALPRPRRLASCILPIVTIRTPRLIDRVFDISIGCTACVLALCMGCVTDLREIRRHFARPLALPACLIIQHLAMPPIAVGLSRAFKLQADIGFGLAAVAAMPGGGLAHLAVFLMEGDRSLSAGISLANCVINIGLTPLWLWLVPHMTLLPRQAAELRQWRLLLWLCPSMCSQVIGCLLCTCRQGAAQSLLNWIGRPLLLLAAILLVTLGIYINHYAIDHLDTRALCCTLAFIAIAFALGGVAGFVTKQSKPKRKAMAAEAACFASLVTIPALRSASSQPTADLGTVLPLAASILSPTPIALYLIAHKAKAVLQNFVNRRKEKHSRQYSIVSSLAKMAEEVTAVSAPLALDDCGVAGDNAGHTGKGVASEKVTAL